VSLAGEYRRQLAWRDWGTALDALPSLEGRTVLDLGCAVGDVAALLGARGARVVGVDGNEELLAAARARGLPNTELVQADLRAFPDLGVEADGLWCSFAAAYFPELSTQLGAWMRHVRPGGWAALTEIDDFFGHEPLGERTKALLDAYAADALAAGRYDFHMGRKLREHAERAGLTVSKELTLEDWEFSFTGPAQPEVLDAWRARFERMTLLRAFCGAEYDQVRDDFLACLARPDHRSRARVCCSIALR
jgi:trans-aconitate methyltransferase